MTPRTHSANPIAWLLLIVTALALVSNEQASADEAERRALVDGAQRVAKSVVRIDRVAAQNLGGDLLEGAPTSGLVFDPEGFVITSRLSIAGNPSGLLVSTRDGTRYGAKTIAEDISRDLVVLKLDGVKEPLSAATLQDTKVFTQGAGVIAVGCAIDSETPLVSLGILSGSGRMWGKALQTDARVSLSQYGGPLLNDSGSVIGIVVPATGTEMAGEFGTEWYDSGVAMAVPASDILPRLDRLKGGETLRPGLLGISWSKLFVPGTVIPRVAPGSPAAKAGLRRGDEIVSIGDLKVQRHDQVRQALGAYDAGDTIKLEVRRDKQPLSFELKLVDELPPFKTLELGVWAEPAETGLSITGIVPKSAAETAGLKAQDVIVKSGQQVIQSKDDLSSLIGLMAEGESLKLELGDGRVVEVKPKAVAGKLLSELPQNNAQQPVWEWTDFALPELPNKARLWGPPEDTVKQELGLLVIAADLNQKDLDKTIEAWSDAARVEGMMVLIVSSRDPERWNVDEAEMLARAARQVSRRWKVDARRVAAAGLGPGATLAVVAAFTQAETFRGVVMVKGLQFPRLRMRPDATVETLRMLWLGGNDEPRFLQAFSKLGYGIKRAEELDPVSRDGGAAILRWNRLLGVL